MVLNSVLRTEVLSGNKNIMGSQFGSILTQYLLDKILTLFERISLNSVENVERCRKLAKSVLVSSLDISKLPDSAINLFRTWYC